MMPSASSKPDNKGSVEPTDPMKNAITVIEKKVRNLEKRKVGFAIIFGLKTKENRMK